MSPTDLLGNWVREREVLTLERAVHKLTGEPARIYGLHRPGRARGGQLRRHRGLRPRHGGPGPVRRVQDFPADGERLVADATTGMRHVLVNGTPIRVDGTPDPDALGTRPGVVLR